MLTRLSATELRQKLTSREVSARDVAAAHIERARSLNAELNAFITIDEDLAMKMADDAQAMIDKGEGGPMTGIPVAVKDNINVEGTPTTCASKILEGYISPYDAGVTRRMKNAGMVLIGKTNLDEFAMGASTETGAYGVCRNPWDKERSPGGSSGGSAAAVAAEMATVSLGSDTGGSIRQPASLTGTVGFKPTYGRVSRYGLVAFASSLDQIGPFGRNVEDCAALASVISGHDPHDSTSLKHPPISTAELKSGSLKGKRFGLPKELFGEGISSGVRASVEAAIKKLEAEGAAFEEISLPSIAYGVTTYYIIAPSEASSNLARFDGVRYGHRADDGRGHIGVVEQTRAQGFGHEVKMRIMIGTYALSAGYYDAFYLRAQKVRGLMQQEFKQAFEKFDFVLGPTSPVPAFKIGELLDDPLALKQVDFCTIPANMGGFPAISLPCGLSEGLPVGLQICGPVLADEAVLQTAFAVEKVLDATLRPPIA